MSEWVIALITLGWFTSVIAYVIYRGRNDWQ